MAYGMAPFLRSFWEDPWQGLTEPSRIFDQHFGGLIPEDLMAFRPPSPNLSYCFGRYPQRGRASAIQRQESIQPPHQTGISEVTNTDKEFRICLDVNHFSPEEVKVTTRENRLVIRARHEERPDEHGFIMREFVRQYVLPKDVDPAAVTSALTRDGILTLKAPKKALEAAKELVIPITMETKPESGDQEDKKLKKTEETDD